MFDPKKLLPITVLMLILSLGIVYTSWTSGTVPMGVDLKGGTVIIIPTSQSVEGIDTLIKNQFGIEARSRAIKDFSGNIKQQEIVISKKDLTEAEQTEIKNLIDSEYKALSIAHGEVLSESVSGFFSDLFFRESIKAIAFAFLFMAVVIFAKFRTFVPSFAVVFSAFADIVETFAAMIVFGIELSKGSIIALLLLIGYSVDTDILLTSRLLKQGGRRQLDETIKHSLFTGLTMAGTTMVAMVVLYLVSTSSLLDTIALVIIIGILFDIMNTWITNLAVLKSYVEGGGK